MPNYARDPTIAEWATGPLLAACVLLVTSGITKLIRPAPVRAAARAIGMPSSPAAARGLGAVEVGVAIAAAVAGRTGALAAALLFTALAGASVLLLWRAPATPCGCVGDAVPSSGTHVAVNLAAAAVAFAAATGGPPLTRLPGAFLERAIFAALVVCAARLAFLTLASPVAAERRRIAGAAR
jgi:uncharacterized protein YjeT (DUF2065 family)